MTSAPCQVPPYDHHPQGHQPGGSCCWDTSFINFGTELNDDDQVDVICALSWPMNHTSKLLDGVGHDNHLECYLFLETYSPRHRGPL